MKRIWKSYVSFLMFALLLGISCGNVRAQEVQGQTKTEQRTEVSSAPVIIPGNAVVKSVKGVSYNRIRITWEKAENATIYQVFRKENGKWAKLGETARTYYNHTSSRSHRIEPGISYQYLVRAMYRSEGRETKGKVSNVNVGAGKTTLGKVPEIRGKAVSDQEIKISWNKVPGVSQYRLYWKDKNGSWKLVKKLGAGTTSYKHKSQTILPGTTYTYTVRAYGKTSGGYIGGQMSNSIRVTTPQRKFKKIFMVGHSRGLGMQYAVTPSIPTEWYVKVSAGYSWLSGYVMPTISGRLDRDTAVVIMMGVNDVYQQYNYVSYINNHIREWTARGASVYYVGIGPVTYDPYVSNAEIVRFNNYLKNNLKGVTFIDSYNYLMKHGFTTTDGAHYNSDTYRRQYQYIMDSL